MIARFLALPMVLVSMLSPALAAGPDATPTPAPSPSVSAQPTAEPTAAVEDATVTAQAKAQFAAWQAGKLNRSSYNDQANKQLTDALIAQVSLQLAALGSPTKFTFRNKAAVAGSVASIYLVETPKGNVQMLISLDAQNKISGIFFRPAP